MIKGTEVIVEHDPIKNIMFVGFYTDIHDHEVLGKWHTTETYSTSLEVHDLLNVRKDISVFHVLKVEIEV